GTRRASIIQSMVAPAQLAVAPRARNLAMPSRRVETRRVRRRSALHRALALLISAALVPTIFGAALEDVAGAPARARAQRDRVVRVVVPDAVFRQEPPATPTPAEHALPSVTPSRAAPPSACPSGMVLVEGKFCPDVRQDCKRWLDDEKLP